MGGLTVRAWRIGWCNGDEGVAKVCGSDCGFDTGGGRGN